MSKWLVAPIDPHDPTALRAWYDALRAGATADRAAPLCASYESFEASLISPTPRGERLAVAATSETGEVVGAMVMEWSNTDDLDLVEVDIDVPPQHRGQGIGAALWEDAERRRIELGRHLVGCELNVPAGARLEDTPGGQFALARGIASRHVEHHLAMRWPGLRPEARDDAGYRVEAWSGATLSELLETMADLRSAMSAEVPVGDLTRDQRTWTPEKMAEVDQRLLRSYRIHRTLAVADDGRAAGYSMAFVDRTEPSQVLQDDTLVLAEHRGHGLGARLKAALYDVVAAQEPDVTHVHTWTAHDNAPMQRINASFGFEVVEDMHEIELDAR